MNVSDLDSCQDPMVERITYACGVQFSLKIIISTYIYIVPTIRCQITLIFNLFSVNTFWDWHPAGNVTVSFWTSQILMLWRSKGNPEFATKCEILHYYFIETKPWWYSLFTEAQLFFKSSYKSQYLSYRAREHHITACVSMAIVEEIKSIWIFL